MKKSEYNLEINPTVEWKARRKSVLSCPRCPPNRGENRKCKHNRNTKPNSNPKRYKRIKQL